MAVIKNDAILYAGIDFREKYPTVCYQAGAMKEPECVPLDFRELRGRTAYFRKILTALKRYGKREEIHAAVVLPDISEEQIYLYFREAMEAGFAREQLRLLSGQESLVHFIMHQTSDIWQQNVWLLEFEPDDVKATCVQVNRKTMPMLAKVREPEYWHVGSLSDGSRDDRLSEIAQDRLKGQAVSAVFLSGTDFNAQDYKKSRETICSRRRVFLTEQLYARGACALARDAGKKSYLFLNEQTLLYNVGIRGSRAGKEELYTLLNAGCSWYEAECSCEVLLKGEPVLEFVFSSMLGGEPILEGLRLADLPQRPDGASRIRLEVRFSGPRQCEVMATDLGFGEFYPATDLFWRETFWLEQEEMDGEN